MTINLNAVSKTLIQSFIAFDSEMRRLNPLVLSSIREDLSILLEPLTMARRMLHEAEANTLDQRARVGLLRACDFMIVAVKNFAKEEDLQAAYISALRAARKFCRAQEVLFPLCGIIPEINRYFLEEGAASVLPPQEKTSHTETGIIHAGSSNHPHERGGYSLYIPETHSTERAWPLVVALHGGYSHGRDFLWSWLREARSRDFVVFAPTSQAMTWSIEHVAVDEQRLSRQMEEVAERIPIDRSRILLTGMSDGGTFALALGMNGNSAWKAIAPVSCALPPVDLRQAKGKRILWVHGAQDWIFPVSQTVPACRELKQAGADIKLKVIEDLSHTYPREANDTILNWFGLGDIR